MSNPPGPLIPPLSGDPAYDEEDAVEAGDAEARTRDADLDPDHDDRPVDTDADPNQIDSADADERASTEGTVGED